MKRVDWKMDFFDLVSKRQSDRGYLDKKVDREFNRKNN